LAWGTVTPGRTPELPLELPEDFAPELPEELPLDFPLELPAAFTAACTPDATLLAVGGNTVPAKMGANPSAMVANQRNKSIVLSVQSACADQPVRRAKRAERKNPRHPRLMHEGSEHAAPYTSHE
jgi:hypothetical protein